ncbi:MAG: septum formation protein Maf [Clostridia bacterium]|nr:septum formation protein Maf [Clostridia bacterium]
MNFILASKSPRRREILQNLGVRFEVVTADTDESSTLTDPCALVEELSRRKGLAVLERLEAEGRDLTDTVVIASDTVVSADGGILGKPRDAEDAARMLRMLSGREHEVISGIALIGKDTLGVSHDVTRVKFAPLTERQIAFYLQSGEPFDKAGAYAIQGLASMWIEGIRGCYFNVVGLPVHRMCTLYSELFGEEFL